MALKAISLFAGVGGLDFGLEAAGFKIAVASEMDAVACRTMRSNRRWPVVEDRIENVPSPHIMRVAGVRRKEADILVGGPPCQPFSKSSYWVRGDALRLDDPRADTLTSYLRVLRDLLPKTFLLENVHGLAFEGKDEGLQLLLAGIERINRETGARYRVAWKMLNAAEHGVPQIRERVFLIGSRDGKLFQFPQATHEEVGEGDLLSADGRQPYRTAWDAIGDLRENPKDPALVAGGQWAALLPSIPEGQNYLWHTNRGGGKPLFGWRTRYWSFLLKLAKNRPSWTIQAQPGSAIGPFHWTNRRLSAREMCRIQTFPDGLEFDCGRTEVQRMLGNAVPSLLTEILGREIRRQLLDGKEFRKPLLLMPRRRRNVPPPERLRPVLKRYLARVGDHADHPGEGKGRRSIALRKSRTDSETYSLFPQQELEEVQ